MQSIQNQLISRIYGRGRGWVFTQNDFKAIGSREAVDIALFRLNKKNTIRKATRGVYYYPEIGKLLGKELPPDTDQIARAIARRYSWRIQITGMSALNYFGLTTQVQGRITYLSDGPGRKFEFAGFSIQFRKTALKESGFRLRETGLMVQAIKALGEERIDEAVISAIKDKINPVLFNTILKESQSVAQWVYDVVKRICIKEEVCEK
ncbi:MAG: DUF6088 family protein [Candidatus Sabulitectum sp.]|nr:DUF6088 family protein [Candidatus Sabulitectum sp.]